ncbi:hypothetical protein MK292_04145 [Myxococcota bacterium]|nr:hypothetical protein [Myxococcota bacterium]
MERDLTEWERIREKGKRHYVAICGIRRGVPMGVVLATVVERILHNPFPEAFGTRDFIFRAFAASVLFSISGAVRAGSRWSSLERRFEK